MPVVPRYVSIPPQRKIIHPHSQNHDIVSPQTKPISRIPKLRAYPLGRGIYLDGVLPLGEVDGLLGSLRGLEGSLVLGQAATDGAGALEAEIKRQVLLGLVEKTQLLSLLGVDDGQSPGDGLANIVARKRYQRSAVVSS